MVFSQKHNLSLYEMDCGTGRNESRVKQCWREAAFVWGSGAIKLLHVGISEMHFQQNNLSDWAEIDISIFFSFSPKIALVCIQKTNCNVSAKQHMVLLQ